MADATGEAKQPPLRVAFDRRLKLEFHGTRITSDSGLLAYRELDDALGLTATAASALAEGRRGKNIRHRLLGLLRQAVYGRLAGYEDVNDAERLARDPAIRSPSWSLLSYVLAVSGSFWLLALLNAAVAAATLELVLVRLFNVLPARRLAIVAGMASLTSLPWFACFLMPDLYAGLLILAAGIVAFAWPTLRPAERYAGSMLLLLAITFHGSHLLLAVTLVPIAMLLPLAHDTRRVRAMRLTLPILAAVAFQLGASWLGFGELTLTPQPPPFLLARSWEDGPARAYLTAACPDAGWTICAHLDRLAASAQEFLWRAQDSYWSLDLDQRAALRAEEGAILRQAIGAAPLAQLRASMGNALDQLVRFGLDDFVLGRGAAARGAQARPLLATFAVGRSAQPAGVAADGAGPDRRGAGGGGPRRSGGGDADRAPGGARQPHARAPAPARAHPR